MKSVTLLSIFLWIAQFGFSQPGLPEKILYKGDTAIVISVAQLDSANAVKVDHDKYKALSESLKRQIDKHEEVYIINKEVIGNLKEQTSVQQKIIDEKEIQNEICNEQVKEEKKKARRIKIKAITIMLAEAIIITLLII